MDSIKIKTPANWRERELYIVGGTTHYYYGLITQYSPFPRAPTHKCAYLNLPKSGWLAYREFVGEEGLNKIPISYEGVGSSIMQVPERFQSVIPVETYEWWVGWDYFQHDEQPEDSTILVRLETLAKMFDRYLELNDD